MHECVCWPQLSVTSTVDSSQKSIRREMLLKQVSCIFFFFFNFGELEAEMWADDGMIRKLDIVF